MKEYLDDSGTEIVGALTHFDKTQPASALNGFGVYQKKIDNPERKTKGITIRNGDS